MKCNQIISHMTCNKFYCIPDFKIRTLFTSLERGDGGWSAVENSLPVSCDI